MASLRKVMDSILMGRSDGNVRFSELRRLLRRLGFIERTKGSHFIYSRDGLEEIINLQEGQGGKSKAYQVKQVRGIISRYGLFIEGDAE